MTRDPSRNLHRPGSTSGATRVGGFLGFSNKLDTALRGALSNQVIMRVRATVPSFWTAETFDRWSGTAWSVTNPDNRIITGGSPFIVPVPEGDALVGQSDIQTFYLATTGPNLVFHAADAHQVWFPAQGIVVLGRRHHTHESRHGPGHRLHRPVPRRPTDRGPARADLHQ